MKLKIVSVKGISELVKDEVLLGLTKSAPFEDFPSFICATLFNSSDEIKSRAVTQAWWFNKYDEKKQQGTISVYLRCMLPLEIKTYRGTVKVVPVYNFFERIINWFKNKYGGFKDDLANM